MLVKDRLQVRAKPAPLWPMRKGRASAKQCRRQREADWSLVLTDMPVCAVISIECMPEACVLVKGKPRVRMVPEKAAEAEREDAQVQRAAAKEEAIGSGTADPAADMFKSKASPSYALHWPSHGRAVGGLDAGRAF